jgi:hypothetical protein
MIDPQVGQRPFLGVFVDEGVSSFFFFMSGSFS